MTEGAGDQDLEFADEAPAAAVKARPAPASAPAPPDLVGTVIGGTYRLVSKLGEGGMGTVFAARDLNLERDVAVKVIREEMRDKATIVARFRREAQCLAQLKHPNVLECYAFGVDDALGILYMVTPLLVGRSLQDVMASQGKLAVDRALGLAEQMCAGLQAAHERGIVHRDLKPANVFVEGGPGSERARLIDFGLAIPTGDAQAPQITRSGTGALMGTPAYMSPEQIAGKEVTALSDLYSVGLVVYQLLTGAVAFGGDSVGDVLAKQLRDPPPVEPLRKSGVSPALEAVVLKATAKSPQERFESARAFADALKAAAPGKGPGPVAAPAAAPPGTRPEAGGGPSDDDLVFTDEVGGKPGAKLPAPAAESPKPPLPAAPSPGGTTASRQRGLGTTSSARVKALGAGGAALEPPRKGQPQKPRAPFDAGGATSERVRRRADESASAGSSIKAGGTLGEFAIQARVPEIPLAASGRYAEDEPLRVWKAERKGREARVHELLLTPAAAIDMAARADRLLSVRLDDLESVIAVGRTREGAYLVLDARETLRQSVVQGGPLSEREALAALRAAARALAGLRQRGLCHGDPSPRHLLLEPEGAVRLASPARVRPARMAFATGAVTGDPRYAAPEVLDGQEPTIASDVYTLGLSLLFLVTGKEPVSADDPVAALQKRVALPERTPDIATAAPTLTAGARVLYACMTAADPAQRPEPAELAAEIDAFLSSGKVPSSAPAPKSVSGSIPRAAVSFPVAVALLLVGLALMAYSAYQLLRPSGDDPAAGFRFEAPTDGGK